ncbi:MAG: molybdenum cofactor guanylyltransferase [Kofleriaceae bacterium]
MVEAADVTAVILAGGRATRHGGATKPLLEVEGTTILARLEAALAGEVADVWVSVAAPVAWTSRRQVVDAVAGAGPLAGVAAALAACPTPWLLVIGGDMPYVAPALLAALRAHARDDLDAVAPRVGGHPEPLLALYGRACAPVAAARLSTGRGRVAGVLDDVRVAWLDEPALRPHDPTLRSFVSINGPGAR